MNEDMFRIGLIVRPQGIRGELKIQPLTDDVGRYQGLQTVWVEQNGAYKESRITVNRLDESSVYAYLEGCYTRDGAEMLRNAYLCVPRSQTIALPEHTWFISDLIGCRVFAGEVCIGILDEVIQTGGVDVYSVQKEDGRHMLFPALRRLIQSVAIETKTMRVDPQVLSEVSVDED